MLSRLLPQPIDNRFRGHRPALWLFVAIAAMNIVIDLVAIFTRDGGAQNADGIPMDTFAPAAAQAVIGVGALLGLAGLLLGLIFVLALVRYRAMIPLMYALLVVDFIGHKADLALKPIPRMPGVSSGSLVTWALFAVTLVGLALSLTGKGYASPDEAIAAANKPV